MKVLCVDMQGEFIGYALTNADANKLIADRAYRIAVKYNVGDPDINQAACYEYEAYLVRSGRITSVNIPASEYEAFLNGEL